MIATAADGAAARARAPEAATGGKTVTGGTTGGATPAPDRGRSLPAAGIETGEVSGGGVKTGISLAH